MVIVPIAIVSCQRTESIPNQKAISVEAAQTSSLPDGAIAIDVNGQALSFHKNVVNDRIRTAAILDGLRKFAIESSAKANGSAASDTVVANRNWEELEILGVTIRRNGVVLVDSVVVYIPNKSDDKQHALRWKSHNMALVEPDTTLALNFESLIDCMKARGIEVIASHPVGRGLWQESLSIRKWASQ